MRLRNPAKSVSFAITLTVVCAALSATHPRVAYAALPVVTNGDFEANASSFTTYPGYVGGANPSSVSGWSQTGGTFYGINGGPTGITAFADNGANTTAVLFLQAHSTLDTTLSQTVSNLTAGHVYTLTFRYNSRVGDGLTAHPLPFYLSIAGQTFSTSDVVPVETSGNRTVFYYQGSVTFTATATSHLLSITLPANQYSRTLLLDNVMILPVVATDPPQPSNADFETGASLWTAWPGYVGGSNPNSVPGWSATGSTTYGINGGASPLDVFNDNGSNTTAVLFWQCSTNGGTLSQGISGFTVGREYKLTFDYNTRAGDGLSAHPMPFSVSIGGRTFSVSDVAPVGGTNPYYQGSLIFTATATSQTLSITTPANQYSRTLLLDNFAIAPTYSQGRQVLFDRGPQILSLVSVGYTNAFTPSQWGSANFTGFNLDRWIKPEALAVLPTGQQWSRCSWGPVTLEDTEADYAANMVALEYFDEPDANGIPLMNNLPLFADAYAAIKAWYPRAMAYTTFFGNELTLSELTTYMQTAKPSMLAFDNYVLPYNHNYGWREQWYAEMQKYRTVALAGYDGTGAQPIPYGQWLSTWRDYHHYYDPAGLRSESWIRLNQFASWAFGMTWVSDFLYNSGLAVMAIVNADFETGASSFTAYPGYVGGSNPTGVTGWTVTGVTTYGINGVNGLTAFADNGANTGAVLFVQRCATSATIGQTVGSQDTGWFAPDANYQLTFDYNSRSGDGHLRTAPFTVQVLNGADDLAAPLATLTVNDVIPVGGSNAYHKGVLNFRTLAPGVASCMLRVKITVPTNNGDDRTLLFDNFQIAASGAITTLFSSSGDAEASKTPNFNYIRETNRQSMNLGPALIRLRSTDIRKILGKFDNVTTDPPYVYSDPTITVPDWSSTAGGCGCITSITPRGANNTTSPTNCCDWWIGYFQPLRTLNDDYPYANGLHFMIVNGRGMTTESESMGTTTSAAANAEWVRIEFNFTGTGFNKLQRLSRTTGQTEIVNLTSLGSNRYRLDLQIDGGTGDLFRFYPQ